MTWTSVRPWLATVARLILGVSFIWSGAVKLSGPREFFRGVVAYDLTIDWLSRVIAYGLPVLEICLGVLLVVGILTRWVAIAAGVLQVAFLIAVITLGIRGIHIDTGAFTDGGVTASATNYLLIGALNVVLILAAALLVLYPLSQVGADEYLARAEYVEPPSPKRLRSEQGRRKYEADLAAAKRSARERNRYLMVGITLPLVLICIISVSVQANRSQITGYTANNASKANGVSVGKLSRVTVDVFEDFQSTASLKFEQAVGADLDKIAAAGETQIRFHPVAIYDASSNGNRYSFRAANAALCASDLNNAAFLTYHRYLFGKDGSGNLVMPATGSHGRTNVSLVTYAADALNIATTSPDLSSFQACVQGEVHKDLVGAITQNFTNQGFTDVPTVLVNGVKLKTMTVDGLNKAISDAYLRLPDLPAPAPATSGAPASTPAASTPAASVPASPSASS